MSKPFRTGHNARRPRVAGLRKRASQPEESQQAATETEQSATRSDVESSRSEEPAQGSVATEHEPAGATTPDTPEPDEAESEQAASEQAEEAPAPPAVEEPPPAASEPLAASESLTAAAESEAISGGDAASATTPAKTSPWQSLNAVADSSGKSDTKLLTLMGALVVVFVVLAAWFGMQASALDGDGAGSNQALVDAPATSEVNGQISDAVSKVFSYDFNDTAKTEKAANELLVGDAVGKYNELFATVKQQAPVQKLIVTTTVKASAVNLLQDDRAEVLLFVDQNAVRGDSGENNVGPAQILVGAEKQGDQWKISQITQR